MSEYLIKLLPAAARQLRRLPRPAQRQVAAVFGQLAGDPRPAGCRALRGRPGELRVRTGDYRVVYEVDDDRREVVVMAVGDRRDVYRRLR